MFGHRLKLDDDLYAKLKKCADAGGYSSAEEFALHVLEREIGKILGAGGDTAESEEQLRKRLQGLGYIE